VFVLNISEFLFIYRYLKRQEWTQILAKPDWETMGQEQQDELLFNRCVLWPRYTTIQQAGLPAGAMSMLVDQIKLESLFLNPQAVANMTLKL
jgi:hypothetical protein